MGAYFGVLKRIEYHHDFFERVWKVKPRFMAVFGKETADIFKRIDEAHSNIFHSTRRLLQLAKDGQLYGDTTRQEFRERLENDIYCMDEDSDRIGPNIRKFIKGIETYSLPLVTHRYGKLRSPHSSITKTVEPSTSPS